MPRVILNTIIIFVISGIWHGANWTFVIWGLYNAILFIPLLLSKKNRTYLDIVARGKIVPTIKESVSIITTFILAVFGWIIFRANSVTEAFDYIGIIFSKSILEFELPYGKRAMIGIAVMIIIEWLNRDKTYGLQLSNTGVTKLATVRWILYYSIIISTVLFMGINQTFIYFQF